MLAPPEELEPAGKGLGAQVHATAVLVLTMAPLLRSYYYGSAYHVSTTTVLLTMALLTMAVLTMAARCDAAAALPCHGDRGKEYVVSSE